MAISLDQDVSDILNDGGMEIQGSVELPVPAAVVYVKNGDVRMERIGGAAYFGGWEVEAPKMEEVGTFYGQPSAPAGWQRDQAVASGMKRLEVYNTRSVLVAAIGYRASWFVKDASGSILRSPDYFDGARRHVQALCYLSSKDGPAITPWGMVVLTAKGIQAGNLLRSFSDWDKHINVLRNRIAPNVPAWCFNLAIGTFGKTIETREVGKGDKTNIITPIGAYQPDTLNEETLEFLFVGSETARLMAQAKTKSNEWLENWGHPTPKGQPQNNPVNLPPSSETARNFPMHIEEANVALAGLPPEDDIPF